MEKTEEMIREIGGRRFRLMPEGSLDHDIYLMQVAHSIGMDRIQQKENEQKVDFAVRLHWKVLESGRSFEVLGGILIPEEMKDEDWTPQVAMQTITFLRRLTKPDDKKAARDALIEFHYFFATGLTSKRVFDSASPEERPEVAQPRPEWGSNGMVAPIT